MQNTPEVIAYLETCLSNHIKIARKHLSGTKTQYACHFFTSDQTNFTLPSRNIKLKDIKMWLCAFYAAYTRNITQNSAAFLIDGVIHHFSLKTTKNGFKIELKTLPTAS